MTWDTPEAFEARRVVLLNWFEGDEMALEFLMMLSRATELWDDLIDKDKPLSAQRINAVFFELLTRLPCNPFYVKHRLYLTPLIIQAINSWQDANVLETGALSERALAYTLRNMDVQIVQAIVYIIGGYERMREISPMAWRMFAADQDNAMEWIVGGST